MVGWHHQLYGQEFEQAPGVVDGQGSQACCGPWGHKVRHDWATELNCGSEVCFFSAFYCFFTHLSWGSFFSHMTKADLPLTHSDSDWGNCLWGVKTCWCQHKGTFKILQVKRASTEEHPTPSQQLHSPQTWINLKQESKPHPGIKKGNSNKNVWLHIFC